MKRNRLTAVFTCAALLLTAAAFPADAAIGAEDTAAEDTTEETTERFGHYGPLTYEIMDTGLKIISCEMDAVSAEIPPEIDGVPVTSVASNAFGSNDALETVVWNSPANAPYGVFKGTGLRTLTLGEHAEIADSFVLEGCEDVHLILDMASIEFSSFNNCDAISELTITDNATYFNYSFNDCPNLKSVHIGAGLKVFDSDSFLRCTAIESFEISAENENFASQDGIVYSKDMTELLRYPAGLTVERFTVPDSVEWVFRHAFYGAQLREIELTDAVNMVGESAFAYANQLEAILVPVSNTYYISIDGVLYDTRYRTLVVYPCGKKDLVFEVPDMALEIGMNAFTGNCYLQKVVIPDSVHTIYNSAFQDCQSLKYAQLPARMEMLGDYIFERCISLVSVTFPEGIDTVPSGMFCACESLREITLPETVRNLDWGAFGLCPNLRTVNLPETMDSLGQYTFEGCESLQTFIVPEGITEIDQLFSRCTGLEVLVLPESLQTIGERTLTEEMPLTDVYYAGTQEQWQAVIVEENNAALERAVIHYGCTEPEPPVPPTGDLDGDGICSVQDAVMLQIYLIGYPMPITEEQLYNADMTQDGRTDSFDLAVMKKMLLAK